MTKRKKPAPKNKGGRPSKYKPEYCKMLQDHMSQGFSFESFAAIAEVNQDTLHEWAKTKPEFSEAKSHSWAKSRLFYEKMMVAMIAGKLKGGSAAVLIFNMKNRFGWRDVQPEHVQNAHNTDLDDALAELDREEQERKSAEKKPTLSEE